jgi:hypothetical protein
MLSGDLSGRFETPTEAGDYSLLFARTWAEKLRAQVVVSKAATATFAKKSRQAEYGEDWSPDELDIERAFRSMWAENVTLIWISHQLEQWLSRLAVELGEEAPKPIDGLRLLRNALEHLNEAEFNDGVAVPGTGRKNPSLRELRDRHGYALFIGSWGSESPLFNLIDPRSVEELATTLLDRLERELDEIIQDYLTQERINDIRGK